jgi:hypothetical protein
MHNEFEPIPEPVEREFFQDLEAEILAGEAACQADLVREVTVVDALDSPTQRQPNMAPSHPVSLTGTRHTTSATASGTRKTAT